MSVTLITGDARESLQRLEPQAVNCCVTSPPYWGLRDYKIAGQLGLEPTPELYVEHLVAVFREVRRVLRDDGTVWLNLGDSYCGGGNYRGTDEATLTAKQRSNRGAHGELAIGRTGQAPPTYRIDGLKPKDLVGIPWRVAFALQANGWWLRSDIIWSKPNPMPESVTDRPTKAHEYLFLLAKRQRYYFDAKAVKEPCSLDMQQRAAKGYTRGPNGKVDGTRHDADTLRGDAAKVIDVSGGRNIRSVWNIATQPFKGAHFATFPEKLVEPCVLAGCPEEGTVLDPFAGSGTVGAVCQRLGRNFVGIELNPDYVEIARQRIGVKEMYASNVSR